MGGEQSVHKPLGEQQSFAKSDPSSAAEPHVGEPAKLAEPRRNSARRGPAHYPSQATSRTQEMFRACERRTKRRRAEIPDELLYLTDALKAHVVAYVNDPNGAFIGDWEKVFKRYSTTNSSVVPPITAVFEQGLAQLFADANIGDLFPGIRNLFAPIAAARNALRLGGSSDTASYLTRAELMAVFGVRPPDSLMPLLNCQ